MVHQQKANLVEEKQLTVVHGSELPGKMLDSSTDHSRISALDQQTRMQLPCRATVKYDPPSAPAVMGAVGDLDQQAEVRHQTSVETEISRKKAKSPDEYGSIYTTADQTSSSQN